jgi:hypothetical protein
MKYMVVPWFNQAVQNGGAFKYGWDAVGRYTYVTITGEIPKLAEIGVAAIVPKIKPETKWWG